MCSALGINPHILGTQVLPLSWCVRTGGPAWNVQIPHLRKFFLQAQKACCDSGRGGSVISSHGLQPATASSVWRVAGGFPDHAGKRPLSVRRQHSSNSHLHHNRNYTANLNCIPMSQLHLQSQRSYHTFSWIKTIITKHSSEESDNVIKSFYLPECTKWPGSLLWLSDALYIILVFELALFTYPLIITLFQMLVEFYFN